MATEIKQELADIRSMKDITELRRLKDAGKAKRDEVPIASLGKRPNVTRSAVDFIAAIEANLIQELLPQRNAKMAASPAAFFRGTAELMAYDLSHEAQSGIKVLADGDAHLQNFGFYASPERNLLFDLNDFDEAAPNSFEFDLKRLATSTYLIGAQHHYDEGDMDELVREVARTYRKTMKKSFKSGALDRFYASTEVHQLISQLPDPEDATFLQKIVQKAVQRDNESVVKKYTTQSATGHLHFKENPPRSTHVSADLEIRLMQAVTRYLQTTRSDTALLLTQYRVTDIIRHSVGIGSFGTACYLILLTGLGGSHLVLQVKEALPRRRELGPRNVKLSLDVEISEGQRIIAAQQVLQKASDPFLGWFNMDKKSFYVRQFRDMKESIEVDNLNFSQFQAYASVCAYLLALGHAQTPVAAMADGYMDKSFDSAIQQWSKSYLHQVIDDYAAFINAYGEPTT